MIVVYTALFGNYDYLSGVKSVPGVRFVAFTDRRSDVFGWECLRPELTEASGILESRKYKTQPHILFPTAEWTIYMDANLDLTVDPRAMVRECEDGLNVFRHNRRRCAYAEAAMVRERVSGKVLDEQLKRYRLSKFPENFGLFWGGLLIRNKVANEFNELWWEEIRSGVYRDQVSLPYVLWSSGEPYHVLPGDIPFYGGTNRFCERKPHRLNKNHRYGARRF